MVVAMGGEREREREMNKIEKLEMRCGVSCEKICYYK